MSRIAFVSSGPRTLIFKAVADRLQTSGHEIFWIITGSDEVKNIITSDAVFVDISIIINASEDTLYLLDKHSEISVNGIIASDRILSKKSAGFAHKYLAGSFHQIHDFLTKNSIDIVFGEATWAGELVSAAVCRMLKIPYLAPVTVRYPSERFAFFEGVFQKKPVGYMNILDMVNAKDLYNLFLTLKTSPHYMIRLKKNNLKLFIKHLKRHLRRDVYDMTVPSLYSLVKSKIFAKLRTSPSGSVPDGRYVLLPLHVAPEASVDVLGGYHRDTLTFIRNVSRALPYGVKLAVKDHPIQTRSSRFYKDISKIPAVVLVGGNENSLELIRNAEAVVSISGTACYEAGLLGVPAFTFADVYFNELPTVKKCTSYEELHSVLKNVRKSETGSEREIAFLAKLYSISYEGYVSIEAASADVLGEQNISNVTAGFLDIIKYYSSPKSATADSICSKLI